jgi:hypothetical protein
MSFLFFAIFQDCLRSKFLKGAIQLSDLAKWIKNERIYTLVDSNRKVLLQVEDRTCNGNYVNESILSKLAFEYFENLEKGYNQ